MADCMCAFVCVCVCVRVVLRKRATLPPVSRYAYLAYISQSLQISCHSSSSSTTLNTIHPSIHSIENNLEDSRRRNPRRKNETLRPCPYLSIRSHFVQSHPPTPLNLPSSNWNIDHLIESMIFSIRKVLLSAFAISSSCVLCSVKLWDCWFYNSLFHRVLRNFANSQKMKIFLKAEIPMLISHYLYRFNECYLILVQEWGRYFLFHKYATSSIISSNIDGDIVAIPTLVLRWFRAFNHRDRTEKNSFSASLLFHELLLISTLKLWWDLTSVKVEWEDPENHVFYVIFSNSRFVASSRILIDIWCMYAY